MPIVQTFEDAETKRLTEKYVMSQYAGKVMGSLGSHESEEAARLFLSASAANDVVVGIKKDALDSILKTQKVDTRMNHSTGVVISTYDFFVERGYVRQEVYDGKRIVLPTEALLRNQKIPLRAESPVSS